MLRRFVLFILLVGIGSVTSRAQAVLFSHFNMNDGMLTDTESNVSGIAIGPLIDCGVQANALAFDGSASSATLSIDLNQLFSGDWSMTLYLNVENTGNESVDILYLGDGCRQDSLLSLRYLSGTDRFRFDLASAPGNFVQLDGPVDPSSCWQYVAVVKEGSKVSFYINGELQDQDAAISDLGMVLTSPLGISRSPCQLLTGTPDMAFEGRIDELSFYDGALSARQILGAYRYPDKIITPDTTIFTGASIAIRTGGSCSSDYDWSPTTDMDDPTSLQPVVSPQEEVTYRLTIRDGACRAIDAVTIRVADPTSVGCNDLVLPSAFTPNGDGTNDTYGISNDFLINNLMVFEIYNRWGGRVFGTTSLEAHWDGLYQGEPAPATSYLYKVQYVCQGTQFTKTGTVNLIR